MPTRSTRTLRVAPAPIATARAVAGPLVPGQPALDQMTVEQLIALIARHEAAAASQAYALGACLRELSQPRRYRDELGFESFEALLVARQLLSRVTAFKLIAVVALASSRR